MFEKEAEDYANKAKTEWENDTYWVDIYDNVYDSFEDGAEFGYKKAIAEIKDAYEGNGNFLAWFENYLEGKNV